MKSHYYMITKYFNKNYILKNDNKYGGKYGGKYTRENIHIKILYTYSI